MRISDWSSDVCSSDLNSPRFDRSAAAAELRLGDGGALPHAGRPQPTGGLAMRCRWQPELLQQLLVRIHRPGRAAITWRRLACRGLLERSPAYGRTMAGRAATPTTVQARTAPARHRWPAAMVPGQRRTDLRCRRTIAALGLRGPGRRPPPALGEGRKGTRLKSSR